MTPAEQLALLLDRAADIRAAGITHLRIGDAEAHFAPAEQPAASVSSATDDALDPPTLDDPTLYGLKPGAQAPGFTRPPRASAQRGDDSE